MLYIIVIVLFSVGIISGYLFANFHAKTHQDFLLSNIHSLQNEKNNLQQNAHNQTQQIITLEKELITHKNNHEYNTQKIESQKLYVDGIQKNFVKEFENLANRIFEDKSSKFTEQNKQNLLNIITPLGEKIKDFELKVNNVYDKDNKERISLKTQIEELSKLNHIMNTEAKNLTKALKGDTKIQGNWGEMILESILQKSGLVKDVEYSVQLSITEANERYRPDVIINLPDNKSLVIDSKVSLLAYEQLVTGMDNNKTEINNHITSVKNHIKGLSGKNYQNLYELNTIDFVLMFIPIEAAYLLILEHDNTIMDFALSKNIIMVCPSTLLATMRTIYSIWRTEKSLQNADEIARIGGELYDRFVGFIETMVKIEKSMEQVNINYNNAMIKLNGNKGIIKSIEKLDELGVKKTKYLRECG